MEFEEYQDMLDGLNDDELLKKVEEIIIDGKRSEKYLRDTKFRSDVDELEKSYIDYDDPEKREGIQNLMHEVEIERLLKNAEQAMQVVRDNIVAEIKKGGPKDEDFKKMAREIMEVERDHGGFDPADWGGLDLL